MFYICRITCNVTVLGTVRLYDVLHPNAAVPRPSLDPDVAALPEACPPGVLDQPVVLTLQCVVAEGIEVVT